MGKLKGLKRILTYMIDNDKNHIPIFGENAGQFSAANNPKMLIDNVIKYGLAGIDYAFSFYLYEEDGFTKTGIFLEFEKNMERLKGYIENPVPWRP